MTRFLLTSLTITWLGACGDKEETDTGTTDGDADTDADTDTDVDSDTDADTDTAPLEPTFSNVWSEVLNPTCVSCHGGGSGGLSMPDQATAYDNLVGVASVGSPSDIRVVAGDSDASYLIHKLEGATDIAGSKMPLSGSVSADHIQLIRDWIDAGAADD